MNSAYYNSYMAKLKETYRCANCGARSVQWLGECPACHEWNTLEKVSMATASKKSAHGNMPVALEEVETGAFTPFYCGLTALDKILGNGLMPGASILVGGEPGIGKSTLLLQLAAGVARQGLKTLYASGEESLQQIRARAERLGALTPCLQGMATTHAEDVAAAVDKDSPSLLIVDSVQTLGSADAEGLPGNVSQVKAVATQLVEVCRQKGTTLILVGHVTKDGSLAGPRLLEHMVDTVISLEGDRRQMFRLLRVFKNRFGPNEDLLVFRMRKNGLEIIDDPSTFFLDARDTSLSGTALVMTMDGQRPFAVEVQALVNRSFLNIPRRTALGFDVNRLHLLLAVLEKRLRLNFGQVDIYAKVGGGIRLQDPGLDLGIMAAILSSYYDLPLPEKSIFWGEVDLNGQIRGVSGQERRLSQAQRLGFSPIFHPAGINSQQGFETIADLQQKLFRKGRK